MILFLTVADALAFYEAVCNLTQIKTEVPRFMLRGIQYPIVSQQRRDILPMLA